MKPFQGFPHRSEFTSIPNAFFSQLLPQIEDTAELKATLLVFAHIYKKKGSPRFASLAELAADSGLMAALKSEEEIGRGLELATERGTLLHIQIEAEGEAQHIYLLNDEDNRQTLDKIESGQIELKGLKAVTKQEQPLEAPNIFAVYEENIGMLTPLIADELKEAEKTYPAAWIVDAIKEAVSLNKRNWRYIARILENWQAQGKNYGAHRRGSGETPDKYFKGKYGHMVQR